MISVVIPLYNKEQYITSTIDSVLAQSFQDFEIVIVNDGSTDRSVAKVEAFDDNRIRLIQQDNAGVSAARNNGIEQAKYEWIALLDGDDIWKPDYLQTQWDMHIKYPECDVCVTNYEFMDHMGNVTPTKINKLPFKDVDGVLTNYFEVASCSHPPIWTSAIMAKQEAIQSVGGFPLGVKSGEDLLTWARLAVRYQIAYSRLVFTRYVFSYDLFYINPRMPDELDLVAYGLRDLIDEFQNVLGLKQYIARWHQIRATIYIKTSNYKKGLLEVARAFQYSPFSLKNYYLIFLCLFFKIQKTTK